MSAHCLASAFQRPQAPQRVDLDGVTRRKMWLRLSGIGNRLYRFKRSHLGLRLRHRPTFLLLQEGAQGLTHLAAIKPRDWFSSCRDRGGASRKDILLYANYWFTGGGHTGEAYARQARRVKELAERYESPLPELSAEVDELEQKVAAHLAKMGFTV